MNQLANLNKSPVFVTKLPSGKEVEFRPITVKEQKSLLIVKEENDNKSILRTLLEILKACTFNKIDAKKLSTADFEWLMIQMRIKSVGASFALGVTCPSCDHTFKHEDSLDNVVVKTPKEKINNTIKIGENLFIELQYPSMDNLMKMDEPSQEAQLASTIRKIISGEDVYDTTEFSQADVLEFVDTLNAQQVQLLEPFFSSVPHLVFPLQTKCPKCDHPIEQEVKGVLDFLE